MILTNLEPVPCASSRMQYIYPQVCFRIDTSKILKYLYSLKKDDRKYCEQ